MVLLNPAVFNKTSSLSVIWGDAACWKNTSKLLCIWLVWVFLITIFHIPISSEKLYRNQVESLKYFWTFSLPYFSRPEISMDKIQFSHSPGIIANTHIADWIQSLLDLRRALTPRKWPQLPDYWRAHFENLNICEAVGSLDLVLKTSENNNRKTMCLIAFIKGQFSFESTFWILLEKEMYNSIRIWWYQCWCHRHSPYPLRKGRSFSAERPDAH